MTYFNLRQSLLTLSILALLSACGGGGGGSSDSDSVADDGTASSPAQVGGNAVKGIVIKGNVVASELDSAGAVVRVVGSAVTGADGGYSLTLDNSYGGGPIEIRLTSGPETTTVCDIDTGCGDRTDGLTSADDPQNNDDALIDFGEEYKPASLSMTALLGDAQNGETIAVQVTPFTHLAARRAASAPLTKASIAAANSEVSVLLGGIDLLRTAPLDITKAGNLPNASAFAIAYSGLAAAIAKQARRLGANNQPDINQALNDFSNNYAASGLFDSVALQTILNNARGALTRVGVTDTSGTLASMQAVVNNAMGGPIDPEPNPNVGDSDVQKTRLFLSDLRTWGTVIGQELDSPSQAFKSQIELAEATLDMSLEEEAALNAIAAGAAVVREIYDSTIPCNPGPSCVDLIDYPTAYGAFTGMVVISDVNGDTRYTITNASVSLGGNVASLNMVATATTEGTSQTSVTVGLESAVAESDAVLAVVNRGIVMPSWPSPILVDYDGDPGIDENFITYLELDIEITEKTSSITFTGILKTTSYPYISPQDGEAASQLPGAIELGGTISNSTGDSFEAMLTVSIPTAAMDAANPVISLPNGSSYADNNNGNHLIEWTVSQNQFTYFNPDEFYSFSFNPLNGSVDVTIWSPYRGYFDNNDPGPYASLTEYALLNGPFNPFDFRYSINIDNQGRYSRGGLFPDYTQSGFVEFLLVEPDIVFYDATKPPIGSIGLQFVAQFNGLPAANVSITGSTTGFNQGAAMVTLSYDGRMLQFSGSNDTPAGEVGSFDITNQDGVKITLDFANDVFTDLTINGRVIATVDELSNGAIKVSYIDGTFEIF